MSQETKDLYLIFRNFFQNAKRFNAIPRSLIDDLEKKVLENKEKHSKENIYDSKDI